MYPRDKACDSPDGNQVKLVLKRKKNLHRCSLPSISMAVKKSCQDVSIDLTSATTFAVLSSKEEFHGTVRAEEIRKINKEEFFG